VNRREMLQRLVLDEDAVFEDLVGRSENMIRIDKLGNVVFLVPANKRTLRQTIALVLLGRHFAAELGIVDSDTMTAEEMTPCVGADTKSITARLAELKKDSVVQAVDRGVFHISILGAAKVLAEIEQGKSTAQHLAQSSDGEEDVT